MVSTPLLHIIHGAHIDSVLWVRGLMYGPGHANLPKTNIAAIISLAQVSRFSVSSSVMIIPVAGKPYVRAGPAKKRINFSKALAPQF